MSHAVGSLLTPYPPLLPLWTLQKVSTANLQPSLHLPSLCNPLTHSPALSLPTVINFGLGLPLYAQPTALPIVPHPAAAPGANHSA